MKNNRLIIITAGAAALIALAVLSFMWIIKRHNEIEAQKAPGRVLSNFNKAVLNGNSKEAWNCLSEESIKNAVNFDNFDSYLKDLLSSEEYKAELKSTEITEQKIENDKATVKIKYLYKGKPEDTRSGQIKLLMEKGKWKIDFVNSSAGD
jgi:hypothetical protein